VDARCARGRAGDLRTTWRLVNMNLAVRGIEANIAQGDSFHADA